MHRSGRYSQRPIRTNAALEDGTTVCSRGRRPAEVRMKGDRRRLRSERVEVLATLTVPRWPTAFNTGGGSSCVTFRALLGRTARTVRCHHRRRDKAFAPARSEGAVRSATDSGAAARGVERMFRAVRDCPITVIAAPSTARLRWRSGARPALRFCIRVEDRNVCAHGSCRWGSCRARRTQTPARVIASDAPRAHSAARPFSARGSTCLGSGETNSASPASCAGSRWGRPSVSPRSLRSPCGRRSTRSAGA